MSVRITITPRQCKENAQEIRLPPDQQVIATLLVLEQAKPGNEPGKRDAYAAGCRASLIN